jgi:hypothetical protein
MYQNTLPTWDATMFVQHDEIGYVICSARVGKVFDNVIATIYPVGIWKDKPHFLDAL